MPSLRTGQIDLCYEEIGNPADPVLLLIAGLSSQMVSWDDQLCADLAGEGFRVVRFDNRDVGLSTKLSGAPSPDFGALLRGDHSSATYTLEDMAQDTVGLLEGLGIPAAHVVGVSMGGMIAQVVAFRHPDRVASLCSIMSTTGAWDVGQPNEAALGDLFRPPATDWDSYVAGALASARLIGSPGFPFDEERIRRRAARAWDRAYSPDGVARQLAAILASPDRTESLAQVKVPTLVIHGDKDPLVDVTGGEATARAIPGAQLLVVPGMGHDLPPAVWNRVVAAIVANARAAPST